MADVNVETLAETENYAIWKSVEPDGEIVFHLEVGSVTMHFFQEEWDEMLALVTAAADPSTVEDEDEE